MKLGTDGLGERERAILDVERSWWLSYGSKAEAIRSELGVAPSTYDRLLHHVVERNEALAYDPLVVRRARRARTARRRAGFAGKTVSIPPN